jgi:benzoate membrane transport protein
MELKRYFHPPAMAAGFVAVLVGYTGSAVIVFQAARAAGASPSQVGSWMMALGLGMGLTSFAFSYRYKMPIITAWSTPGAALLVTSLAGFSLAEAIGAFIFSAILMIVCGFTGWFERAMHKIPMPIAGAMLAGILVRFGIDVFKSMQSQVILVGLMFLIYLLAKRFLARYAIIIVLLVGGLICLFTGLLNFGDFQFSVATPEFVMPAFSLTAMIGVGIPLFIVTMVSQNIPGIAVLRASGYQAPISSIISWTGITTLLLAPFGGFAFNLAAITAAICTGPEAHEDPQKRYIAGISTGVVYILLGLFGATVASLFAAFPVEFVLTLAGLALISTIANSLQMATSDPAMREPAIVTFLATASGLSLFGIGSAFWGLVAGVLAMLVSGLWRSQADQL